MIVVGVEALGEPPDLPTLSRCVPPFRDNDSWYFLVIQELFQVENFSFVVFQPLPVFRDLGGHVQVHVCMHGCIKVRFHW